jgi:hypothetical protein
MIPRAMLAVAYPTGRASHARQVKGDDPDKKGYPGPPGWGFGVGLTTPCSKKLIVTKVEQKKTWMDLTMMERVGDRWEKMEGYCSTGQSPPWAVVPMEEEEAFIYIIEIVCYSKRRKDNLKQIAELRSYYTPK